MGKLYELTTNYNNLTDLLDNADIPREIIKEALDQVEGDIADKLENIAKLIRNIETDASALREEEKRLADRRHTSENRVKNLKMYAEDAMRATGLTKVKGSLFTLAIQKNPPSVLIGDVDVLPKEYFCEPVEPAPDKKHIMEALKAGVVVPGAELAQSESLRIR